MLKVEFHSHTNYLQKCEGKMSPSELIDTVKAMGYDALAFTEHYNQRSNWDVFRKDPLKTYYDFKDYAKEKGLLLIPGTEVMLKEGEVLLINFTGNPKDYRTLSDLDNIPRGTLVAAPHPFFMKTQCVGPVLEKNINKFDAIEYCFFYTKFLNRNEPAVELAKKYNKPMIATSDVHRKYQLNRNYTLVDSEKRTDSIIRAVRNKKIEIVTRPLSTYLFTKVTLTSLKGGIVKLLRT